MRRGRITYVGHATTLIELDGVVLLTDPLLRDRIGHVRRIVPPGAALPLLDAVLISHAHRDHLDLPSLRRLPDAVRVYAPPAAAAVVRRAGRPVQALLPGDRVRIGEVEVLAVPALHDGRRVPVGADRKAIGFVISGSASVYFAGDTDLFAGMTELAGGVDTALLPVWGWGPKLGPGHMDPERAARAAALLAPRAAIPIHWGTYATPGAWWREDPELPAREFARLAAVHAPGVAVRILSPGRSAPLRPAEPAARR
jgi:L-ascorbate metabolism protein UlaG (beta-lactamase superfamily)